MILRQSYLRRINKDLVSVTLLTILFVMLVAAVMLLNGSTVWGSRTDWISQHFAIPEYFRTRFYETGDLFPDFAPQLGGGQNIYNFAYYGLLNPLYLPAYLLPQITMADYIQAVSLISVLISCIIFYFLMKRHFTGRLPFMLAVMLMCSAPLLFHSHRHVMFVNYFPFLLAAMSAVNSEDGIKSRGLLIASSYCILCSSFYFSVSAFACVMIYAVFVQLKKYAKLSFRQLLRLVSVKAGCIAIGCITAGALWVPTFFTLLSGREDGSSFVSILKLLIPTVNLQYLLYSSYSVGMTAVSVVAVIALLSSGDSAAKFLAAVFTGLVCCPLIIYLCNGTMYLDSKVLIPFVPLLLIVCGEFFVQLFAGRVKLAPVFLIFAAAVSADMLFNYRKLSLNLLLAADSAVVLTVLVLFSKRRKRRIVLIPTAVLAVINCVAVNLSDSFVERETMDAVYSDEISQLVDKTAASDTSFYRFANDSDAGENVNRIYSGNYYTPTVYSSVSNSDYRDFRFGSSASENSCRNNAIQSQPHNEIFNILMGCRYRISKSPEAMLGETTEDSYGGYHLFRNGSALPAGYASANTMSEDCFDNLDFAAKSEALLDNIIVPGSSSLPVIPTKTEKLSCGYALSGDTSHISEVNGAYEIKCDEPFEITARLDSPVNGKLILLQFRADNRIGKKSERDDISVTVNGVKNKLSAPDWKYNNKNYEFSYVLSSDKPIEELVFGFSEGNYIISDFEAYTLDGSALTEAGANKDEFVIDRDAMGGDTIEGSINVTADGWFNLSVPYDEGFEILVDGVETEYFRTNTAFIGFPIKKGEHFITINYRAPYRTVGMFMTIGGLGMSFGMLAAMRSFQRRRAVYGRRAAI